jgi:hypothetical protein
MKKFIECCKDVGFDAAAPRPTPTKIWYAYKDGVVILCRSEEEAKTYKFWEYVPQERSRAALDAFKQKQCLLYDEAVNHYEALLREEYEDVLTAEQFDICYAAAYDRGHSYGYDEVTNIMVSTVEFALKIIESIL